MINIPLSTKRFQIVLAVLAILVLSLGLSWVSPGFDFFPFTAVILLGASSMLLGWWILRNEAIPSWVGRLMIGAAILRLALGVTWFLVLPAWGHGSEVEKAGYVMSDASRRDRTAWSIAQSGDPLVSAFTEYRLADQYGGLLFFSAAVYRFFGSDVHQPLMMVVLTASFSAGVILFTWAFSRRLWGESVAKIAVWILALYPEAILLGSAQMREAFMMTLLSMALYGLVIYWQEQKIQGIVWVFTSLVLSIPLSTMFAVMLFCTLFIIALILFRNTLLKNWTLWALFGGLLILGIGVIWIFGERIYPNGASNPLALIREWLVFSGRWEKRTVALSSGWFSKILNSSPEWMHIWLVLGYGTVQPFLPAALIATGNWFWRIIALWRSIGWTIMLVFLFYAPFRALKKVKETLVPAGITVIVWIGILLAAFRGGGDQWDNPRYRVVYIGLQASLMAWVWIKQRETGDPWLRRILVGFGMVFAWFVPWYLRRYSGTFTWPIIDLFKTVALGFITAILYWLWDWARREELTKGTDKGG